MPGTYGYDKLTSLRQDIDETISPTDPTEGRLLGHAYMDTISEVSSTANLGATAFDALMIRSAIESA